MKLISSLDQSPALFTGLAKISALGALGESYVSDVRARGCRISQDILFILCRLMRRIPAGFNPQVPSNLHQLGSQLTSTSTNHLAGPRNRLKRTASRPKAVRPPWAASSYSSFHPLLTLKTSGLEFRQQVLPSRQTRLILSSFFRLKKIFLINFDYCFSIIFQLLSDLLEMIQLKIKCEKYKLSREPTKEMTCVKRRPFSLL